MGRQLSIFGRAAPQEMLLVAHRLGDGTSDRHVRQAFSTANGGRFLSGSFAPGYPPKSPGNDPLAGHPPVKARDTAEEP